MNINELVLYGMVWAQFGQEAAGRELIQALASPDETTRVVARIMLGQGSLIQVAELFQRFLEPGLALAKHSGRSALERLFRRDAIKPALFG